MLRCYQLYGVTNFTVLPTLRCFQLYGVSNFTVLRFYGFTVLRFYGVTVLRYLPVPLVYLSASDRQEEKGRFGKVQGVQM